MRWYRENGATCNESAVEFFNLQLAPRFAVDLPRRKNLPGGGCKISWYRYKIRIGIVPPSAYRTEGTDKAARCNEFTRHLIKSVKSLCEAVNSSFPKFEKKKKEMEFRVSPRTFRVLNWFWKKFYPLKSRSLKRHLKTPGDQFCNAPHFLKVVPFFKVWRKNLQRVLYE